MLCRCLGHWRWPAARHSAAWRHRNKTTPHLRLRNPTWRRSPQSSKSIPKIRRPTICAVRCWPRPGHPEEALADFNKAISLDPNYAQAYANRALLYRQTGKPDLALADYNKALSIDGNYVPAYLGRGIIYREQGHSALALADFNKAIALKPDNAQAYYQRGLLYQSQHQHQFAIDDFSTAHGARPAESRACMWRGRSAIWPSATPNRRPAILTKLCRSTAGNLQAWTSRGLAYERLGQKDKAAGSYAKALNINEKYEAGAVGFARVGGKVGQSYPTF